MVKIYRTEVTVDKKQQLLEWWKSLDENKMLPNQENYKKIFLGIFDKEDKIIEKEGNKMIESMNLIDLYANKHKENIEKKYNEMIATERKKSSLEDKAVDILNKATEELTNLYLSQLDDKQLEKLSKGENINQNGFSLLKNNEIHLITDGTIIIDKGFINEQIKDLLDLKLDKLDELNDLIKTAKAHVGIAKTKVEVEEILNRYGIIDKKGKLVTE